MKLFLNQSGSKPSVEAIRGLPEQGQLVEVRGQRFVVTDIRASGLARGPVFEGENRIQHLVFLSSVEDDALGEELEVIWELEGGAALFETRELPYPDGFDLPERLEAFLDAVRWGGRVKCRCAPCAISLSHVNQTPLSPENTYDILNKVSFVVPLLFLPNALWCTTIKGN